jgi:glycosyltransferase involved in cell wall biosynthesis
MTAGVSFVVTVYNKAAYLPRVAEALFAQEGDFEREIIFVDDGSTDGSGALLDEFCAGKKDIRVIHQKNAGLVSASNAGARAARYQWLKLVDGDDVLAPWCAEVLLDAAGRLDAKIALGTIAPYTFGKPVAFGALDPAQTAPHRRDLFAECLRNVPCNLSPMLIDRQLFWEVGGADPRLTVVDLLLMLRLSWKHTVAAIVAPVCACPQGRGGRMSDDVRHMLFETNRAMLYFLTETPQLPWRMRHLALERAFARAWKWQRRHLGATFASRWFWLYALAKLGPPGLAAPFLASTLDAFAEPLTGG